MLLELVPYVDEDLEVVFIEWVNAMIAEFLQAASADVTDPQTVRAWYSDAARRTRGGFGWCHGVSGVGQLLVKHAVATGSEDSLRLAEPMASMTTVGAVGLDSTNCHGLCGSIEFLLDLHRMTGDSRWLLSAQDLTDALLLHSSVKSRQFVVAAEQPEILTGDFMVGMAGALWTLTRVADPAHVPRLLSLDGARMLHHAGHCTREPTLDSRERVGRA